MGVGAMATDLRAAQLENLGLTPGDWARLPGKLRGEILQAAREDVPASYRPYVKRYFRAMAKAEQAKVDADAKKNR